MDNTGIDFRPHLLARQQAEEDSGDEEAYQCGLDAIATLLASVSGWSDDPAHRALALRVAIRAAAVFLAAEHKYARCDLMELVRPAAPE